MTWTEGYASDIAYTMHFPHKLSPGWLSYVATVCGVHAPDLKQPFTYAELGCGHGVSTAILAAAYPHGRFFAWDFDPGHVAGARDLAADASLENLTYREQSFQTAAEDDGANLPMFDVIALHGVYTWVTEPNRRAIRQFIDRRLKPGGLVYVSYNCMPGWASALPLQRLLMEQTVLDTGTVPQKLKAAMALIERLIDGEFRTFRADGPVARHAGTMKKYSPNYLAHEYLNEGWQPLYYADVARAMAEVKLTFLGSADITDNIDECALPPATLPVLADIKDPILRQTLRDYAVNANFRSDIYVRGRRPMSRVNHIKALREQRYAALVPPADMSFQVRLGGQVVQGASEAYGPIRDALAEGPRSTAEICEMTGLPLGKATRMLADLSGRRQVHPAAAGDIDPEPARRFNAAVARKVFGGEPYRDLAAPVTGTGFSLSDVDIMALDHLSTHPHATAAEITDAIYTRLANTGYALDAAWQSDDGPGYKQAGLVHRFQETLDLHVPTWRMQGLLD